MGYLFPSMGYASFDLFRPSYGREYLWRCAVGHILRGRPSFPVGWRALRAAGVRSVCLCPPMTDGDGPGAPDLDTACRTAGSFFHCCCWCWWWWWWKAGVTAFHTDRAPRAPIWCRPRGFSVGCAAVSKHLSCLTFNVLVYRRVRSFLN